jgi:hypothetical protein
LNRHLKQHPRIARILGFKTIPHRTTISRWWKCKEELLQETISAIGDFIQFFVTNTLAIFDTTPMEDEQDPDAKVGRSSRGYFTGFKLHAVVNQLRIPLRVEFTPGNLHGSPCLRKLGCGLKALFGLADAEYDAKLNEKFLKDQGIIPVIAKNPRNSKQKPRRLRYHILLKHHRYLVEQFNSLLKTQILKNEWTNKIGLKTKVSFVYAGVLAIQVIAISSLLNGNDSLFDLSWY